MMQKIKNYINGELIDPVQATYFENFEPATGKVYSLVPDSDTNDVNLAVKAAENSFETWSNASHEERSAILMKVALLIEKNAEQLARAEAIDNGKPIALAREVDIPRASENFHFFATAILHEASKAYSTARTSINYTLRQPLGTVACISPWNLPLYLFTWKIAPALASGNCVVAKPSEITPMTAFLFSKLCIEAGLPKGVLNIVHGYGYKTGAAMVEHPNVKAISFTGGTKTGEIIAKSAAPKFKKLSLELGGKNPNIIFADCNYDKMLNTTIRSSFANQGQICLCGSRIFVENKIYEQFKKDFVEATQQLKIGDPLDEKTQFGAVVSKAHQDKVLSYIKLAKEENGKILTGGNAIQFTDRCRDGYFIAPTIIENLTYTSRINQEEIFGPVVSIMPFDSVEEVLHQANSVRYGLASSIWTNDLNKAHLLAQNIEAGIVWINCWLLRDLRTPFGGMKDSGIGREGGFEALNFFTEEKNICIQF